MSQFDEKNDQRELLDQIVKYVETTSGLKTDWSDESEVSISQSADAKSIVIQILDLKDVLIREDSNGKSFIQVNLFDGKKLLLTEALIGFKPFPTAGLDLRDLPKVVTTPDLLSVFEATEEAISSDATLSEVDTLKKVFEAILLGGEAIGFDLSEEKSWFQRLANFKASA